MTKEKILQLIRDFEKKEVGDIMVVGGGISGIQASLDLASSGFKVYLVDRAPGIGGHMAQLDKTFPTNDCSMCIESPKLVECSRHPNIKILTYTEVEKVDGEFPEFRVSLIRKPRYIDEERCTGCGMCTEFCPIKVEDEYNQKLSKNKAIHVYFSQAVPLVAYINRDNCLYLSGEKCSICAGVCKNKAIDLFQKPKREEIEVGAIILAPGFEVFDPSLTTEFGYGVYDNVVTSLDYERLLCSTGPYEGEILRKSDKRHPKKVAWIQCVGSRTLKEPGSPYCSSVCCAYTQKQVILTKEHEPDCECVVFHNDIRSFGKDFERFYQRASNLKGVRFIRSYVSLEGEIPDTKNLRIRYATEDGVKEEDFDMVVLSVGLKPPSGYTELAQKFGIELNGYGFSKFSPSNPIKTSRPGIFVSGAFQGPMDIPESVVSASGAASQCGEILGTRRNLLTKERLYPEERDTTQEEPRVGVFVCHCGANIGRVVNVPEVVRFASRLKYVVHAQESIFACSTDAAKQIADAIKEKRLNRVVVAACTPRTHEPLFRDTLREGGINQYYFEMANIREHCSWVHPREKERATKKAKDLVRMAVARAVYLAPLEELRLPIDKRVLVVGGGIAGMVSALSIARQGYEVYLVEKEETLGGNAKKLYFTLDGFDVRSFTDELIGQVLSHPNIHVRTNSEILDVTGYVGNFSTRIRTRDGISTIKHGVAIVAVGAEEYKPKEYMYGKNNFVVTNFEFEELLAREDERIKNVGTIVMIQCVGSRNEERNYCSRICCNHSVKNALKLKEKYPEKDIYILFRDMRTYGFNEDYYFKAQDKEVRFIRYDLDIPPTVEFKGSKGKESFIVKVVDRVIKKELEIEADMLVLASAVIPHRNNTQISKFFKVPINPDGFFQEAHVKLRPVDFSAEGVFLCGMAHYPKHVNEAINQAYGAAGRALTLLSKDYVLASGAICEVDEEKCVSCRACISVCKYDAIEFYETERGKKARVNPVLCKGDGLCNAKCPTNAIQLKHFTDTQLYTQIREGIEALREKD
ncbi:MAG: CoB--CoM heterodisulfide reductase iron-sulfur subunit A family protein [Deltaproteobacteria bacterium]|nr:CoB--CoM heterodisulfide reductase iron-sulfur subunit A family protein [Deltaproteobacteria bacterium]